MALTDTPNKLESVWIQRNPLNQYYEQINISGSNLIVYHSSSGEIQADRITDFMAKYGTTGGTSLNTGSTYPITSSWALNAISSSYALSASYAVSSSVSSHAVSASFAESASYSSITIIQQLTTTQSLWATQSLSAISASYASSSLSSSYMYFDGQRAITRTPYSGLNLGTTTVTNFLEEFFFPFLSATISINSTTLYYETGSSQNIGVNGSITANSETVFGSGSVRRSGVDWYTFTSASSYSTTDTGVSSSKTYETFMEVGNDGSPTLIDSSTKTVTFLYPYIMGLSTVAGLTDTTLYTTLVTKSVSTQASPYKTGSFGGTAKYIYFCYPTSYTPLTSIRDPNNFEILSSFDYSASVPVSSSGLTNTAMGFYRVYRTTLQSNPNGTYLFYHS